MSKTVPKYVLKLLNRRAKLAMDLIGVCCDVDAYCEKIGVDMVNAEEAAVCTYVTIYTEPWSAYQATLTAIENVLHKGEKDET